MSDGGPIVLGYPALRSRSSGGVGGFDQPVLVGQGDQLGSFLERAPSGGVLGGDSPVALFVMGRISADHPSLTVTDLAAAGTFKQYFPGP